MAVGKWIKTDLAKRRVSANNCQEASHKPAFKALEMPFICCCCWARPGKAPKSPP